MVSFEFLGRNDIITRDGGRDAEHITERAYLIYAEEVRQTGRTDIELIPYFTKLSEPARSSFLYSSDWPALRDSMPIKIADSLKPYQAECVFEMCRARRALNACLMGMGKTIQAICTLSILRNPGLGGDVVVCPGSLRANWQAEFKKWAPDMSVRVIDSVGTEPLQIQERIRQLFGDGSGVTIISYELFSRLAGLLSASAKKQAKFNTIVCDESHYLKETSSARYKALRTHLVRARNLFLLSGTPSPNRPVELFAQLQLIDPETFSSKELFSRRYCDAFVDQWGRLNARGASNTRELAELLSRYMVRVTHSGSSGTETAVTRTVTEVTIGGFTENHTNTVREVLRSVNTGEASMTDLQSTVSSLFLETSALKIDAARALLRERLDGEKVIFFCTHMVMFDAIKAELEILAPGKQHIAISGSTPMHSREALIAEFLGTQHCTVALLTLGTCSTGINLVPVSRAIFLELSWTPAIIHQAECRINRIGAAQHVHYEYLIAKQTLDDYVYNMLHKKHHTIRSVIDRDVDVGTFDFE